MSSSSISGRKNGTLVMALRGVMRMPVDRKHVAGFAEQGAVRVAQPSDDRGLLEATAHPPGRPRAQARPQGGVSEQPNEVSGGLVEVARRREQAALRGPNHLAIPL